MLFDGQLLIEKLIASFLVGYLLGSVPFAQVAARLNGMDIFRTGSHKAGTANVFWNVGRRTGAAVLLGDVVKGVLAVAIARLLGLDGLLLLLPAGAAILGHWNSIFTRFRGGDGMATLLGASLALAPVLAVLGIAVGSGVVLALRRSPSRSACGITTCFTVILVLSLYANANQGMALGLAGLAGAVLWHSIVRQRNAGRLGEQEELDLSLESEAESQHADMLSPVLEDQDLGQTAPQNP